MLITNKGAVALVRIQVQEEGEMHLDHGVEPIGFKLPQVLAGIHLGGSIILIFFLLCPGFFDPCTVFSVERFKFRCFFLEFPRRRLGLAVQPKRQAVIK